LFWQQLYRETHGVVMNSEVESTRPESIEKTRLDESAEAGPDEASRRRQARILDLFGTIDFDPMYD
jgi:hypothetical protein